MTWIKSSHSGPSNGCVEVAALTGGHVAVRDSKDPSGAVLQLTAGEFRRLLWFARIRADMIKEGPDGR